MKIIVFGPTGGTGRLLVDQALAAGHLVTAFARDLSKIDARPGLKIVAGSIHDAAAVATAIAGHDAVLSALGGRLWRAAPVCGPAIRNVTAAMKKHGLRRIVVISTFGAGDTRAHLDWFSRNVFFRFVLRWEVADKEAMERHLETTGLDWTVVRIGTLTNGPARGTWRVGDDGAIRGLGKIARADVAAFMLSQLTGDEWVRRKPVLMD